MSKQVILLAKCDWPDCGLTDTDVTDGLTEVDVWFYKAGKGRKPAPVRIDLCPKHRDETAAVFAHFMKVGDPENAAMPENRSSK